MSFPTRHFVEFSLCAENGKIDAISAYSCTIYTQRVISYFKNQHLQGAARSLRENKSLLHNKPTKNIAKVNFLTTLMLFMITYARENGGMQDAAESV
jgi:hypothetical protein